MARDYNVVPANLNGEMRYVVTNNEGSVVDDMNGYGYKNKTTAHRGYNYKRKNDLL